VTPSHAGFPTWLEWSGLPLHLNEKIRIGAWSIFHKIVELDCERNRTPDAVEISVTELATRCGVNAKTCRRLLDGLRKQRVIIQFVPESDDEPALFQVRVPPETPISFEEVAKAHPELRLLERVGNARYARAETPVDPEDPSVRRVVDLYLDEIGLRMNSFILDELIFIAQRFPGREIERTFRQARRHERPSLAWIARELRRRHGQEKKPAQQRDRPR
jgi:hypothetical protein